MSEECANADESEVQVASFGVHAPNHMYHVITVNSQLPCEEGEMRLPNKELHAFSVTFANQDRKQYCTAQIRKQKSRAMSSVPVIWYERRMALREPV